MTLLIGQKIVLKEDYPFFFISLHLPSFMQFLSHLCALASFLQSLQSFLPQFAEAVFAANNKTDANNTVANFFMMLFLYF
jgi:hypothetical protein